MTEEPQAFKEANVSAGLLCELYVGIEQAYRRAAGNRITQSSRVKELRYGNCGRDEWAKTLRQEQNHQDEERPWEKRGRHRRPFAK